MGYISLILILAVVGLVATLKILSKKFSNKKELIVKIFAIFFIGFFLVRLVSVDAFDAILALQSDYLSELSVVLMLLLRGATYASVIICALTPFYSSKTTRNILCLIVPVIALLNIIFFNTNIDCFFGVENSSIYNYRGICFGFECVLMATISIWYLISNYKNFYKSTIKGDILRSLGIFLLIIIAVLPVSFFNVLFGSIGDEADGFTLTHRLALYFTAILGICLYYAFKNKDKKTKELTLMLLSTACLIQFCYTIDINNLTFSNLPLHICNTGVFLIFIAYIFRVKSVFYFTFFVNVIGAIFALVLPDTSGSLFESQNIRFWYNHVYVTILPILGCVWNVYGRPNLKMMKGAIIIFSIYFVSMIIANAYINSFSSVDYFFLQGDVISGRAEFLRKWQLYNVWTVMIDGISYYTYWLYDIFLYFGYIILMFLIWLFYSKLFKIQDHYMEVANFMKIDKKELREIRKILKNNMNEPLNNRSKKMIKISHFSKRYGNADNYSVEDFSLDIHEGEVFGFLGHNGAGKSTLIKSMVGIQSITDGKIEICGYDISKQPLQAKALIGYVSDNHAVYEHLTGREYVNYVADLYRVKKAQRDEIINKYIDMFELREAFDNQIKSYSHGMKQKLVVISALVHNPKVWILDEPLTGLDPTSAYEVKECMLEHAKKGNIVFFSSHVIEVVEKICDKIAIIKKGKLQGVFDLKELKEKNIELEQLYMNFIDEKPVKK